MQISFLKLAIVVATTPALFQAVVAQTWTSCDPLKTTCPPDPALAGTYKWNYGGEAPDFTVLAGKDVIIYNDEGAVFRVEKKLDAPTLVSDFYIMWGKLEVTMKAAPGPGIVSSLVLQSDDLDEIDWEWVGAEDGKAQSNYFGKGNTDSYDRGGFHDVDAPFTKYHKYGIEWTETKIDWLVNDVVVRTLFPAQAKGFYPQTPCQVRIGSWAAGDPSNAPGVISWSGGPTEYSKGPYDMLIKDVFVQDYSSGKEYVYTDKSGSWQSIKAVDGQVGAGPQTGPGNDIPDPANKSPDSDSGSFNAPTNSGRFVSSTTKSEPTPGSNSNNADSSETTPAPGSHSDSSSGHSAGKGEFFAAPESGLVSGGAQPTGSGTSASQQYTGSGNKALPAGILLGAVGMAMGWLL